MNTIENNRITFPDRTQDWSQKAQGRQPAEQAEFAINFIESFGIAARAHFAQVIYAGASLTAIRVVFQHIDPAEGLLEALVLWGAFPPSAVVVGEPAEVDHTDRMFVIRMALAKIFVWCHCDVPGQFPCEFGFVGDGLNNMPEQDRLALGQSVATTCLELSPLGLDWLGFDYSKIDLSRKLDGEFYQGCFASMEVGIHLWRMGLKYAGMDLQKVQTRGMGPICNQQLQSGIALLLPAANYRDLVNK